LINPNKGSIRVYFPTTTTTTPTTTGAHKCDHGWKVNVSALNQFGNTSEAALWWGGVCHVVAGALFWNV